MNLGLGFVQPRNETGLMPKSEADLLEMQSSRRPHRADVQGDGGREMTWLPGDILLHLARPVTPWAADMSRERETPRLPFICPTHFLC